MATAVKYIDVALPVSVAYNQWTQFEEFPRFMKGVQEVRQLDDQRLHWRAEIGGKNVEWDALIRNSYRTSGLHGGAPLSVLFAILQKIALSLGQPAP